MTCFNFLDPLTFTIVTLSVSSKTVAPSSKWQLSSSSSAYLLASLHDDRKFIFSFSSWNDLAASRIKFEYFSENSSCLQ